MRENWNLQSKSKWAGAALLIFSLMIAESAVCQQKSDSTEQYFVEYTDQLLLRLYTLTKSNSLFILNKELGRTLNLLPNGQTNLGFGFNYKGFGLGVSFGLPKSQGSIDKYGQTRRFDIQGSIYGSKFGGDGFFQIYRGYYNSNPDDFVNWDQEAFPQIPSMTILSLGATGFFFFNPDKFSYRASYIRDVVQNKSAGSFILGFFLSYDNSQTDNGFIPQEFPDSLRNRVNLKSFQAFATGLSIGYSHTFVYKNFFFNATVVPGFGYQNIAIQNLDNSEQKDNQPAGQVVVRAALGYEHPQFFVSIFGSGTFRSLEIDIYEFQLATEQLRVMIGKRFKVKK